MPDLLCPNPDGCEERNAPIVTPVDLNDFNWLVKVNSIDQVTKVDYDHAYITPDESVYVWNYEGTELIKVNGSGGGGDSLSPELLNKLKELPIYETEKVYVVSAPRGVSSSKDLVNWQTQNIGTAYDALVANGKVYVCSTQGVFESTDGYTFTVVDGASGTFRTLDYQKGIVFASNTSGQYPIILINEDGTVQTITQPSGGIVYSVKYGKSNFIAIANNGVIMDSNDGLAWTVKFISVDGTQNLNVFPNATLDMACDYANDVYVIIGRNGAIYVSNDCINWNTVTVPEVGTTDMYSVCYSKVFKKFYAVGNAGILITSTNGTTWTKTQGIEVVDLRGVNETITGIIATGYNGKVLESKDGKTFTNNTMNADGNIVNAYNTTVYDVDINSLASKDYVDEKIGNIDLSAYRPLTNINMIPLSTYCVDGSSINLENGIATPIKWNSGTTLNSIDNYLSLDNSTGRFKNNAGVAIAILCGGCISFEWDADSSFLGTYEFIVNARVSGTLYELGRAIINEDDSKKSGTITIPFSPSYYYFTSVSAYIGIEVTANYGVGNAVPRLVQGFRNYRTSITTEVMYKRL